MSFYQKHLFFCSNLKESGKQCCGASCEVVALASYAKQKLIALQQHGAGQIRVSTSGCLGRCKIGPNLLIYPDNIWYTYKNQQDIDEIIETHILGGSIVDRLRQPE